MPTYLGWNVVTIPSYPPAPASYEMSFINITSVNVSPFTGQQQVNDWQSSWFEMAVTMPAMQFAVGQNWITFLVALKGQAGVFQFGTTFGTAYPEVGTKHWRLKNNTPRISLSKDRIYSVSFEIKEAF